jgi:3-hydroxyisobutyrate dehydrogenase-like beta-hydroxyacid dehydrogenase
MKIAFLGLGIMGASMAANLAKAGHDVTTWNRTSGKSAPGTKTAATPAQAAAEAEVVWICVSDTAAVEQVLFGNNGVASSVRPGTVVVDSSTISPMASVHFAERLRPQGVEFVDAPVTGSKIGAAEATLIFIVGGKEQVVAQLGPLFAAMGKQVIRVGENGKGLAAKLAMNLQIALIYEGFAEGLALATRLGVPSQALFDLVRASMIRSGVVDYKIPFVAKGDYSPNFPLRLMHKDIRLMLEAAEQVGVALPALKTIEETVYQPSHQAGYDELDYAATLLMYEKAAGKTEA